jgi:hypothetical protein
VSTIAPRSPSSPTPSCVDIRAAASRGELGPLLGVLGQDHRCVAEQPTDGLGAGVEQQAAEADHLAPRQPARRTVLVGDLGRAQRGDEVFLRVGEAAADERVEIAVQADLGRQRGVVDHAHAGFDVEDLVDVAALLLALVVGDAEQGRDDERGQLSAEVGDVVEATGPDVQVEEPGAEAPDALLETTDPSGVNARETSDRSAVWSGGSMKIIDPPTTCRGP